MTTPDKVPLARSALDAYGARITPLRTGGRIDVEVPPDVQGDTYDRLPVAFENTDVLGHLRRFFDALEAEAHGYAHDPVALAQALARTEALLADVRYVRDSMRALASQALAEARIRRLTVQGVTTVEGTTEVHRTEWQHTRLLGDVMYHSGYRLADDKTGELIERESAAAVILTWLRPEWKMTPLRELGLDPDDYCTLQRDDDGKPIRTPAVRMVDNIARRVTS
jgi:hypothetical protein